MFKGMRDLGDDPDIGYVSKMGVTAPADLVEWLVERGFHMTPQAAPPPLPLFPFTLFGSSVIMAPMPRYPPTKDHCWACNLDCQQAIVRGTNFRASKPEGGEAMLQAAIPHHMSTGEAFCEIGRSRCCSCSATVPYILAACPLHRSPPKVNELFAGNASKAVGSYPLLGQKHLHLQVASCSLTSASSMNCHLELACRKLSCRVQSRNRRLDLLV